MQATQQLSSAGQSIWLDNITRELLLTGTLERYIRDLSVVGLTSNPTIFDKAFRHGTAYDASFRAGLRPGTSHEDLFFQLALEVASARWQRAFNAGARPQRLLFASTGTKDPKASDVLYVRGLIAPLTVNTMPEGTLHAFAEHGEVGPELRPDGGDSAEVLLEFGRSGINHEALATRLQEEGATAFVASWKDLLGVIASKTTTAGKV